MADRRRSGALTVALASLLAVPMAAGVAAALARSQLRASFEHDVGGRTLAAGTGFAAPARGAPGLARSRMLQRMLGSLAETPRLIAAATCSPDLALIARTPDFPDEIHCGDFLGPGSTAPARPGAPGRIWRGVRLLRDGPVDVSAIPIIVEDQPLGIALLVQEPSREERLQAEATRPPSALRLSRAGSGS